MPIPDYSLNPDENTKVPVAGSPGAGVTIAEGCPPGNMNDAIRQIMADCKLLYDQMQAQLAQINADLQLSPATETVRGLGRLATSTEAAEGKTGSSSANPAMIVPETLYSALAVFRYIPRGIITMWSGSVATIPSGWALCNGQGGTPNLTDRFIVGAGSSYTVGLTGGATTHLHGIGVNEWTLAEWQMPSHTHRQGLPNSRGSSMGPTYSKVVPGTTGENAPIYVDYTGGNGAHTHTAWSGAADSRPLFYALAYIMKL